MALGYQNPCYLKQAQKKQQSLYDGNVLLEKHDPPVVHDSEKTLQLAQESREKMKQLNKEIKLANYTNINHLSGEAAKFVGDFKSLAKEADESLAKHKALELEIKLLLRAVVSAQTNNESGTSANTKFAKQSIVENLPKVDETHALSKLVTSNSVLTPQESKVVKNDKQCLISVNPDVCLRNYVNGKYSRGKKQKANVSIKEKQKKHQPKVKKPKQVGFIERLATPKPRKPRFLLRWSPTGRLFDQKGKIVDSNKSESQSDCFNDDDNACTSNTLEPKIKRSKHMIGNLKLLINFIWKFIGTVCFKNDHVAAILGFGDLQWGNILITRVYFVEGLGHNLFSVGQLCDSDLEVAFRRNACFVRTLDGVDLLKGGRSSNLYIINIHEMASASPIYLMARASSTKSWLWHQHLSHLNFDTINDLARNDLVSGLPKFKYHKEHLCPSCEQGKKQKSISSTKTCSKFKAEITSSSHGFIRSNENC
nr:hypothetical protein [Tanacetum cinerariifolium]GEZ86779.1 hypothetical protein [Tanacetum cinerariifolium]